MSTQLQIFMFFNRIRKKLDEKEKEYLKQLKEWEEKRKEELNVLKERLENGVVKFERTCGTIENTLSLSSSNIELYNMNKRYRSRFKVLFDMDCNIDQPFIECHFSKEEEDIIHSAISNLGKIHSKSKTNSSLNSNLLEQGQSQKMIQSKNLRRNSSCEGVQQDYLVVRENEEDIYEGEECIFRIIPSSREEEENLGKKEKFEIKVDGISKPQFSSTIKKTKNGNYLASLSIQKEGKYPISFLDNKAQILSSVELNIKKRYSQTAQPKLAFGTKGKNKGELNFPCGVALDENQNLLVCDNKNNRIQIFNSKGDYISQFGKEGSGEGEFQRPWGIKVRHKRIFVVDCLNHRIQKFSLDGRFISTFGSKGDGHGQFNSPLGMALDQKGNLLICDCRNHRIEMFDSKGNYLSTIGEEGQEDGQLQCPIDLTVNSKGEIIVCDCENHRIQVFDPKGNFLFKFGSFGTEKSQFSYLTGITTDSNDNILVCDSNNNRVQVFNPKGDYISSFGSNLLKSPAGIVIDNLKRIIIAEEEANQISIF